jgi:hypothetical protein
MRQLSAAGQRAINDLAQRHGFSSEAVLSMLRAFDDPNYNTVAFVCGEIEISRAPRTMTVFSM